MIACLYQDLFPYIIVARYGKWNAEWSEKSGKLKEIKQDTRPLKENNRFRKDETIINRLKAGYALLFHGYFMECLTVPEFEL